MTAVNRMDFIQAVVRIRVLEKRLLSELLFNRLIEAKDLEEVFRILNETDYAARLTAISRKEDYEHILSQELEKVYQEAREISPDPAVVDLLALKYDFHNLKVLLKEKFLNKDLSSLYLPIGSIDFSKIKKAYYMGNLRGFHLDYWEAISKAQEDFLQNKDPQRIDMILDRFYIEQLYQRARKTDSELFIDYVRTLIDFTNIRSLLRMQKMEKDLRFAEEVILPHGNIDEDLILNALHDSVEQLLEYFHNTNIHQTIVNGLKSYQETRRLTDFEKFMDDHLMEICRRAKYIHFGPEPIFAYVVAKETEIKNLRIIMVSKLNNISPEATRKRVRDIYV